MLNDIDLASTDLNLLVVSKVALDDAGLAWLFAGLARAVDAGSASHVRRTASLPRRPRP